MFKNKYYCLVAGLPDLFFSEDKAIPEVAEFKAELEAILHPADFKLVRLLFLPNDNKNLINLLFKIDEPFNEPGNFRREFLESQIQQPDALPDYMVHYIEWAKNRESNEWNVQAENKLTSMFYEFALKTKNEFLNDWFQFELYLKNILITRNSLNYNYTLCQQLVVVHGFDEVRKLLAEKKLQPEIYQDYLPEAETIFKIAESDRNIGEKEKELDKIRWNWLDEHSFFYWFSIEKILSHTIKLMMIERWLKLDKKTGDELLKKLIEELANSYRFADEFSL